MLTVVRCRPRATLQTLALIFTLSAAQAAEIVNLGVPNYNNIILPYFVGVERGYFRDEGLEVRLIRVNGVPLKLISSTLDRPFSWVYARPEIHHVNELKGNSIAVTTFGAGPPFFLMRILKENFGWNDAEREMRWLASPQPLLSLANGSAGAALLGTEDKGKADAQGMKLLLDLGKYVRAAFGATAVTESTLAKNGPLVEKFLRGVLKGLWFVRDKDKKEDAIKIMAKWLKADLAYAREIFELSQAAWTREGTASDREMRLSLEMSRRALKSVRQELTPADMYDFAPIRKAKQELEAKGWTP
jgi:ABC-type nitrate/sulfonate/bicarbonate transport system substrate-binding protein